MADVPEQRVKVSVEETQFLGGTTESFAERFAAASNWIANNIRPQPVGSVVYSKMTEAQFQAVKGVGWILSDGRSVVGSAYQTLTGQANCVDLRGLHVRGQNNGRSDGLQNPDGTALRALQADGTKAHPHATVQPTNMAGTRNLGGGSGGAVYRRPFAGTPTFAFDVNGATQMYCKYGVMNAFVRIN
jgi:hypothetical protein